MAKKPSLSVWGLELHPELLRDLQSEHGSIRTRAFLVHLYERAVRSAALAIFTHGGSPPAEEAKELGKEAVVRLVKVLAERSFRHPQALPAYLYSIIETVLRERRRLVLQVARDEGEAQRLEGVPAPAPMEELNQYPWFLRLALSAAKSCGLSARDLDIFWTVQERSTENQKEKTAVYEELATKHGASHDRIRGIYFTARKRIRKRITDLLAEYPRMHQLDFYKHTRLLENMRQIGRG